MQASVADRIPAQTVDFLTATAADPEMGEGPQRHINLIILDKYDHEGPSPVRKPDDCAVSLGIDAAMDDLHRRIFFIKCDARVGLRGQQCNVSKANVRTDSHDASQNGITARELFHATMLTNLSGT